MRKAAEMVGAFMLPEPQMKDVTPPREPADAPA
jgi:hypothetical protein